MECPTVNCWPVDCLPEGQMVNYISIIHVNWDGQSDLFVFFFILKIFLWCKYASLILTFKWVVHKCYFSYHKHLFFNLPELSPFSKLKQKIREAISYLPILAIITENQIENVLVPLILKVPFLALIMLPFTAKETIEFAFWQFFYVSMCESAFCIPFFPLLATIKEICLLTTRGASVHTKMWLRRIRTIMIVMVFWSTRWVDYNAVITFPFL